MSRPLDFWADLGDNRIGPIIREMIDALEDSESPHLVRKVSRRLRMLSSSLDAMALEMPHDKMACQICNSGSVI